MNREQTVVGTILAKPDTYLHAMMVEHTDFTANNHIELWREIQGAFQRGTLSKRNVIDGLRERKVLDSIGDGTMTGEEYIHSLPSDPTGLNDAVEAVLDLGIKKQLQYLAGSLKAAASNGKHYKEIIDETLNKLIEARRISGESAPHEIGYYLPDYIERIDKLRRGEAVSGWAPHLTPVKHFFGTVDPKDFMIVAGEPGGGKSSYLRYEGLESALRGDVVITFNGENDEAWFLSFAAANLSKINTNKIKNPRSMSNTEWTEYNRALEKVKGLKWILAPLKTAQDMKFVCKQVMAQYGRLDLIQVDQISNMTEITYEGFETISYELRHLARDLNVPLMAAHQLNRGNPQQPKKDRDQDSLLFGGQRAAKKILIIKPQKLEDSEAGLFPANLGEDGRVVPERNRTVVVVKMDVVKNTSGSMGITDEIAWNRGTNEFNPLEKEWRRSTENRKFGSSFKSVPKPVRH